MMARRICTVPGCTRPVKARDRCQKHYDAARHRGDIAPAPKNDRSVAELLERLAGRLTARQLRYWLHRGVLRPANCPPGSGSRWTLTPAEQEAIADVVTMFEQLETGDYFRARRAYHEARAHYDAVAAEIVTSFASTGRAAYVVEP